ncbi:MAG: hypothetical protein ABSG81_07810 [Acidimicrobiales bacterium]
MPHTPPDHEPPPRPTIDAPGRWHRPGPRCATLDDTGPAPGGAGDLFGLTVVPGGRGLWFVDNGANSLDLLF